PSHAAQGVKPMDRHVEQQNMVHLLAKPPKARSEEEIGMNAGDLPDRAQTQRARNAADASEITAVLHNGVDTPGGLGSRDEIARLPHRLGHRLFAEHMTAGREASRDDLI